MEVKIDTNYTPAEVRELCASLVKSGLLTEQEVEQEATFFNEVSLCFLEINLLLLPFLKKFISFSKEEIDGYAYHNELTAFYLNFTLRLLRSSPLRALSPTCSIDRFSGELTIQAGHLNDKFYFGSQTEYLVKVERSLNELLQQLGHDAAYHVLSYDEVSAFLLLSEAQYQYLLINRVLDFDGVEYSEVEVWRQSLGEGDLLF